MTRDKPYPQRSTTDDKIVVAEMLRDHSSGQWHECYVLVMGLVQRKAHNISPNHREDIVQEAMMRVHKYLPTFKFQCSLKTWIHNIVHSCVIDGYRKSIRTVQYMMPPSDSQEDFELDGDIPVANMPTSLEDECIIRAELREACAALLEYVSLHSNEERNRTILRMVLFESSSLEETARAVGCSAPVAGYIVRSAQRYVREKLGYIDKAH
jgi:RNA polymerase sigma factor (sigma-70 family)